MRPRGGPGLAEGGTAQAGAGGDSLAAQKQGPQDPEAEAPRRPPKRWWPQRWRGELELTLQITI